jgi:hypothetical protein
MPGPTVGVAIGDGVAVGAIVGFAVGLGEGATVCVGDGFTNGAVDGWGVDGSAGLEPLPPPPHATNVAKLAHKILKANLVERRGCIST